MFGSFQRPVGAAADVRELEYVAALHQSGDKLRTNGTISAADVRVFLKSRHGIDISSAHAIDIVQGLTGTKQHLPSQILAVVEPEPQKIPSNSQSQADSGENYDNDDGDDEPPMGESYKAIHLETSSKRAPEVDDENPLEALNDLLKQNVSKIPLPDTPNHHENNPLGGALNDLHMGVKKEWKRTKSKRIKLRTHWQHKSLDSRPKGKGRNGASKPKAPPKKEDVTFMDLAQMVSILLIPTLMKLTSHRFSLEVARDVRSKYHRNGFFFYNILYTLWAYLKFPYTLVMRYRERRRLEEQSALRPGPDTLVRDILQILLEGVQENEEEDASSMLLSTSSSKMSKGNRNHKSSIRPLPHAVVTDSLVRSLLEHNNQFDAAGDELLIHKMVEAVGGYGAILDESSFARALTSDVTQWRVGREEEATDIFEDIYGFKVVDCNENGGSKIPSTHARPSHVPNDKSGDADENDGVEEAGFDGMESFYSAESSLSDEPRNGRIKWDFHSTARNALSFRIPKFSRTASFIDYASDNYRDVRLVISIFMFFILLVALFVAIINYTGALSIDCEQSFKCTLVNTMFVYAVFALVLSIGGIVMIVPISLGNHPCARTPTLPLYSLSALAIYTIVPLSIYLWYVGGIPWDESGKLNQFEKDMEALPTRTMVAMFVICSIFTAYGLLKVLVSTLIPKGWFGNAPKLKSFFQPKILYRTGEIKRAGTVKLNNMVMNAFKLHNRKATGAAAEQELMANYIIRGESLESSGGLFWTWKRIFNRDLFKFEGVWLHSRFVVGQIAQVITIILIFIAFAYFTKECVSSAENARQRLINEEASDYLLDWVPESWAIYGSCIIGSFVASLVGVTLIVLYAPNTISTILKLRSGVIPSLHDPHFQNYRVSTDMIYYNLGSMVYALIGSVLLFFILIGGLFFLLFYKQTSYYIQLLVAWGIGTGVMIGLKTILLMFCRAYYYKVFYRSHPWKANDRIGMMTPRRAASRWLRCRRQFSFPAPRPNIRYLV